MLISLEIEIPGHPVSANRIWRGSGRRVYKTPEAVAWERTAIACTKLALSSQYGLADLKAYKGKPVCLEIYVTKPSWRGKTKRTSEHWVRPDLSNFIKLCEDSVFEAIGLDDGAVKRLLAEKLEVDGEMRTLVRLCIF